ncbi:FAD-dependent oxidoreductase, partial [Coralloluteibacterium stylophorae]
PPARPDRRRFLAGAVGAALATALPACATRGPQPQHDGRLPRLRLARPDIDAARVIRQVAGLRPHRAAGFRVEAERIGDTLVIHDYGHGGCGVTLSWGTARLALAHALAQPERTAAVIGCGAVGLATARLLQDHGFAVTIYARELPPYTTSNIAGAQWGASDLVDPEYRTPAFAAELARAARMAHLDFQLLPGASYGVSWKPLYMFSRGSEFDLGWDWATTPELFMARRHAPGEHPFGDRTCFELQTMLIEPNVYLAAMIDAFRGAGGRIERREFRDLAQLQALPERLAMNCTGLGARALFGDTTMQPVKGQLVVLAPQPEIDYCEIGMGGYMFPRSDGILLGGSHERGNWDVTPDPAVSARILAAHRRIFADRPGWLA